MTAPSPLGSQAAATVSFTATLAGLLEVPHHVQGEEAVRAKLKAKLELLPQVWQTRIGALLNLGRTAHERSHVVSSIPEGHEVTPLDALALCDKETRRLHYLERSLAMMCSERLDLDTGNARVERAPHQASVFERAWSRFGRELASSEPDDWTWLAQHAGRTRTLEKVYLRRGEGAWWSFGVDLDRPHRSQVGAHTTVVNRRRGNQCAGLASLANARCAERRALQRAMRSVRARMGIVSLEGGTTGGAR